MKNTVLITGTNSGIGKSLANEFGLLGWDVICSDSHTSTYNRNDSRLKDVSTVIDCGAINHQFWVKEDPDGNQWMAVMENNCRKLFELYNDTIESLRKHEGIFLTFSSDTARYAMSCSAAYCSSKAATTSIMKVMAREEDRLSEHGKLPFASFITISPATVPETNMVQSLMREYMIKRNVDDFEKAKVDFLSRHHNGTGIPLDGITDFVIHLLVENRKFTRSISGSDLQVGELL